MSMPPVSRRILAVMQNMWVREPLRVAAMLARQETDHQREKLRRLLIERALFAGCKTGRILRQVFGDLCEEMVWEESTREIASNPRDTFPPDDRHIRAIINEVAPSLIVTFGKIAGDAVAAIGPAQRVIPLPHPCARQPDTLAKLEAGAAILRGYFS
jgi:hypothetical protein